MADHPSNRPTLDNLDELFTYHPPTPEKEAKYRRIRQAAKGLVEVILRDCPPCADTDAAIRKVREAVMTANAAIALRPAEEK